MNHLILIEKPKQRVYTKELEERAIEFHGHGGPFMVIGLRMGLLALNKLDAKGWFNLECTVALNWVPPDSCVIDGIQSSTGCTIGKHNIEVIRGDGISAVFSAGGTSIRVSLRDEILAEIKTVLDEGSEKVNKLMKRLVENDFYDLFLVENNV